MKKKNVAAHLKNTEFDNAISIPVKGSECPCRRMSFTTTILSLQSLISKMCLNRKDYHTY